MYFITQSPEEARKASVEAGGDLYYTLIMRIGCYPPIIVA